jgi:hypothetical protein
VRQGIASMTKTISIPVGASDTSPSTCPLPTCWIEPAYDLVSIESGQTSYSIDRRKFVFASGAVAIANEANSLGRFTAAERR